MAKKKVVQQVVHEIVVKRENSRFEMMVNLVVKKIFQCSCTRTTKKSITCSLVARRKVFFERNELTAVKVEASSFKVRPSRSLCDHFFTKFDISLNYRRFFSLPLDFNSALRRRYNVQSAQFVLQLSVPLHATKSIVS